MGYIKNRKTFNENVLTRLKKKRKKNSQPNEFDNVISSLKRMFNSIDNNLLEIQNVNVIKKLIKNFIIYNIVNQYNEKLLVVELNKNNGSIFLKIPDPSQGNLIIKNKIKTIKVNKNHSVNDGGIIRYLSHIEGIYNDFLDELESEIRSFV